MNISMQSRRWPGCLHLRCRERLLVAQTICHGFSLVEVLIAMVVLAVSVAGTVAAFNVIVSSINRSADRNSASLAIDNDISQIKRLAASYTACQTATGAIPASEQDPCGNGTTPEQAEYFFPIDPANINNFFKACSGVGGVHIVDGFLAALRGESSPGLPGVVGAGVTRTSVARENSSDSQNHNIIVRYSNGRTVKVAPVLSAWCP